MAINFPSSPSNGDTYTYNGVTYVYNSTTDQWIVQGTGSSELYVLKTGDTMTGSLTSVGYTGTTGTFSGDVKVGGTTAAPNISLNADGLIDTQRIAASITPIARFKGMVDGSTERGRIEFKGDGSATFAGNVISGASSLPGESTEGAALRKEGLLQAARTNGSDFVFQSFVGGNSTPTAVIKADGSATFAGGVTLGSIIYGAQTSWVARSFYASGSNAICFQNGASGGVKLDANATAWGSLSQRSTKTNLTPLTDGLVKISSLTPYVGEYKNDLEHTRHPFLIAEQVQAVLPEAVSGDGSEENPLGLRYTEVIPLLVSALHDTKARIEALEAQLSKLTTTGGTN